MKAWILAVGVLTSSAAFGAWQETRTWEKEGTTKKEISLMLIYYPTAEHTRWIMNMEAAKTLAGNEPRYVIELTVSGTNLKWDGPNNSCSELDSRQFRSVAGGSVHFSDNTGIAWTSSIATPDENWDPCGEGSVAPEVTRNERVIP